MSDLSILEARIQSLEAAMSGLGMDTFSSKTVHLVPAAELERPEIIPAVYSHPFMVMVSQAHVDLFDEDQYTYQLNIGAGDIYFNTGGYKLAARYEGVKDTPPLPNTGWRPVQLDLYFNLDLSTPGEPGGSPGVDVWMQVVQGAAYETEEEAIYGNLPYGNGWRRLGGGVWGNGLASGNDRGYSQSFIIAMIEQVEGKSSPVIHQRLCSDVYVSAGETKGEYALHMGSADAVPAGWELVTKSSLEGSFLKLIASGTGGTVTPATTDHDHSISTDEISYEPGGSSALCLDGSAPISTGQTDVEPKNVEVLLIRRLGWPGVYVEP